MGAHALYTRKYTTAGVGSCGHPPARQNKTHKTKQDKTRHKCNNQDESRARWDGGLFSAWYVGTVRCGGVWWVVDGGEVGGGVMDSVGWVDSGVA